MKNGSDTIAVVFDDDTRVQDFGVSDDTGAHRLFRGADGRLGLEPIESRADFERIASTTGSFRCGRAIRDPKTAEVIGYEMEEVMDRSPALAG